MSFNWIILTLVIPTLISAARIQLIDITPEEAQKLITQQSLDLRYAKKLSEGSANGRSYNGKIIDSDDYAEEIYEANQFHGQDGLGRAIFGYTDNQQSRLEARNANGEVRGQYQYIDPFGNDIQVQYWVDSLGYHQTDNHPRFELQPVTDTPEVKQAREEHERLWKEAARLNGVDVDATDIFNRNADKFDDDNYQDNDEQELEGQVSNQHQSLSRYPVLPYSDHIAPDNAKAFGQVNDDSVIVDTKNNEVRSRFARQQNEVEEVTSEPRGFFYSFDYQVPFIADRNARLKQGEEEAQASENIEHLLDIRIQDNGVEARSATEAVPEATTQHPRVSEAIHDLTAPKDEVHDTQTNPKQHHASVSENIRDGYVAPEEIHDAQTNPNQKTSRGSVKFSKKN